MIKFLKNPNIPCGRIDSVLVDYRINPKAELTLKQHGITIYKTKKNFNLYEAVAGHADMAVFHAGENRFIVAPEMADYYSQINGIEIIRGNTPLEPKYPLDIAYNAARVGERLIHNFKHTDNEILRQSDGLEKIQVSQGYSKCSVCVVSEDAIITSDAGIAKAMTEYGVKALLVNDESIKLEGVSHGFIGGSTGLIAPNLLAVNGCIEKHDNNQEIIDFCKNFGVSVLSLHDGEIEDIGSIIPLTEKL